MFAFRLIDLKVVLKLCTNCFMVISFCVPACRNLARKWWRLLLMLILIQKELSSFLLSGGRHWLLMEVSNKYHSCWVGMTLNCIHIFIVTDSFLYWCVMRPASQRFFIHNCIHLRILIISNLVTFLGTNSLSVLNAVKQSINQSILLSGGRHWLVMEVKNKYHMFSFHIC